MVRLFAAELTATGRPVLLSGEVERGMLDKVDLVFHGPGGVEQHASEEYRGGYIVLTNYRLIWITRAAPAAGVPCHLPLPAVSAAEHKGGLLKAARIKLQVRVDSQRYPTPDPCSVAQLAPMKMVCHSGSSETLHGQLQTALQRQAWAAAPPGLLQMLAPVPQLAAAEGGAVLGRVGPGSGLAAGSASDFQPSRAIVEGLVAIGYPRLHAMNASAATRNAGVQAAVNWLCDNEGSPALDQPSPYLQADGSSASPAQPSSSSSYPPPAPPGPLASGGVMAGPAGGGGGGESFANPLLQAQAGSSGSSLSSSGLGPAVARTTSARGVGVSGILKQEEMRAARTDATLEQATRDLSALMAKARDMVELAQYFRERVAAREKGGSAAASEGEEELDAETALDLADLGIASPVTKESAGSLYHQELARQLADFLRGPMARAGGMVPLPDVYCLYNRARGVELVSPDDLLRAVQLFPQVRAPYALREFASGVKVVQSAGHSDEAICRRLAAMVQPQQAQQAQQGQQGQQAAAAAGGEAAASDAAAAGAAGDAAEEAAGAAALAGLGPAITRLEVAVALGVSVAIAGEHLRVAEARGVLCRDDGPRGLVFYRNFFADAQLGAAERGLRLLSAACGC